MTPDEAQRAADRLVIRHSKPVTMNVATCDPWAMALAVAAALLVAYEKGFADGKAT